MNEGEKKVSSRDQRKKKWDDENLFVCWEGVSVKTQVNGAINQKVNWKVFS